LANEDVLETPTSRMVTLSHSPTHRSNCENVYSRNIYQFERPGIGAFLTYSGIEGLLLILILGLIEVYVQYPPAAT